MAIYSQEGAIGELSRSSLKRATSPAKDASLAGRLRARGLERAGAFNAGGDSTGRKTTTRSHCDRMGLTVRRWRGSWREHLRRGRRHWKGCVSPRDDVDMLGQRIAARAFSPDATRAWRGTERGNKHAIAVLTMVLGTRGPRRSGKTCPARRPSIPQITYTPGLAWFTQR